MIYTVFDLESDGLLDRVSRIHCLCYKRFDTEANTVEKGSLTTLDEIRAWLPLQPILVGHNIIKYDKPVLEKMLGVKLQNRMIDTLGLSWYLYPMLKKHGLEVWGRILGIKKPEIKDWRNLSVEEYIHRCSEDVEINDLLFHRQLAYLKLIYDGDREQIDRIMGYISYKLDCASEQELVKWKLDVVKCKEELAKMLAKKEEMFSNLIAAMPEVTKYKKVNRPKVFHKQDGTVSAAGNRWLSHLLELGLTDSEELLEIKVEDKKVEGNPNSPSQLKAWLFSLGWVPQHYKYVKKKAKATGNIILPDDVEIEDEGYEYEESDYVPMDEDSTRAIPQIASTDGTDICPSVKLLYPQAPALRSLEGLYILKHRIGILEGFLENMDKNGYLKAEVQGFTNTLRFKHTTIVNLPTVMKPYGEEIRGCLIAPEGYTLCGSDMSNLEDNCKRHYMFPHDPDYVREMMEPTFDAHLDIAIRANMCTKEQSDWYKWIKADDSKKEMYAKALTSEFIGLAEEIVKQLKASLAKVRDKAKKANFAAVYGVGVKKLSLTSGLPESECKILLRAFWARNWAVKEVARLATWKTVHGQMWLYNSVSGFWYSLRYEKDIFSTCNQGTGVYCFDTWVRNVRRKGHRITGQFHDEIIMTVLPETKDKVKADLKEAIREANEELQLNILLDISVDFGASYADIH